jgi:hypothetical protein
VGSAREAAAAGVDPLNEFGEPDGQVSARCGDFIAVFDHRTPSCGHDDGKQFTSAQLARLPRDPHALLAILNPTLPSGKPVGAGPALGSSVLILRSGLVPADLRAAIYQALALLPGLQVTDRSANLDGRVGVALGVDDEPTNIRREIIIDPDTGQFIGERIVQLRADARTGLPAGTLLDSSSVTTGVVGAVGQVPPR